MKSKTGEVQIIPHQNSTQYNTECTAGRGGSTCTGGRSCRFRIHQPAKGNELVSPTSWVNDLTKGLLGKIGASPSSHSVVTTSFPLLFLLVLENETFFLSSTKPVFPIFHLSRATEENIFDQSQTDDFILHSQSLTCSCIKGG